MPIEIPTEVGQETRGEIVATIAGDPRIVPGEKKRGEIELLVDGETKSRKWTSWHNTLIEAMESGKFARGSRWAFQAYMKKGDKGVFRNLDGILGVATVEPPSATAAAIANGPKAADDYTEKERATNRRTALMQAVVGMGEANMTIEEVLANANAYYDWLEVTNGPPTEAQLQVTVELAPQAATNGAAPQGPELNAAVADMEALGHKQSDFRKWAHENHAVDWSKAPEPAAVIALIGQYVRAMEQAPAERAPLAP